MVTAVEQEKSILVNLGEVHVSADPEVTLSCLGLGSCIALCMYDPRAKIGGMAHIVLPFSTNGAKGGTAGSIKATKYADVAIPCLLQEMRELGAVRAHLVVKIAGGSEMLAFGASKSFNTGQRNYEAIKQVMADEALKITAADVGGSRGRTVRLVMETGQVLVKSVGGSDAEL